MLNARKFLRRSVRYVYRRLPAGVAARARTVRRIRRLRPPGGVAYRLAKSPMVQHLILSDVDACQRVMESDKAKQILALTPRSRSFVSDDELRRTLAETPDRVRDLAAQMDPEIRLLIEPNLVDLDFNDPRVGDLLLHAMETAEGSWFESPGFLRSFTIASAQKANGFAALKEIMAALPLDDLNVRRALFDMLLGKVELMATTFDNLRLILPIADRGIAKDYVSDKQFEKDSLLAYRKLISGEHRPVFVDIGANVGTHGLSVLRSQWAQKVVLIEPDPRLLPVLRANIALNEFEDSAIVVPFACSTESGFVTLFQDLENWGDNRLGTASRNSSTGAKVQSAPVDFLLEQAGVAPSDVDVLWIDVQGAESDVLTSASRTASFGCNVVVEYDPHIVRLTPGAEQLFVSKMEQLDGVIYNLNTGSQILASEIISLGDQMVSLNPTSHTDFAIIRR
jgi:FkbM family methyltransferase